MALLEASHIGKEYSSHAGLFSAARSPVVAVKDVSFSLEEGESLALVGESGSGKTTLGKMAARLLTPSTGQFMWKGVSIERLTPRYWGQCVQMVFQDPSASLNPKLTVRRQLIEPLLARGAVGPVEDALQEMLAAVGLPDDALPLYPHQFSGGQKQRLAIARALMMRPRVLVADEPVSALDLSVQAQILNLLMELKEKLNLTMLFISHDLTVVSHLCSRVIVLKDGVAVESGATQEVLKNPQHPYTRALLDSVPAFLR